MNRIGRYEIEAELGRGGFGRVYRAHDPVMRRAVAIKLLTAVSDEAMLARFSEEAGTTGNLRHRNIITVHDYGEHEGQPYLVMELLEGRSLEAIIESRSPLSLLEKADILSQTADGLRYAHERGIVHRDIKPSNIMLLEGGGVKVLDFGIARVMDQTKTRHTTPGFLIGTLEYMAPDQLQGGDADALTDIYSFGVVAYELLSGTQPFRAAQISRILYLVEKFDPPPLMEVVPQCPEGLQRLVQMAIVKDRTQRYQSLQDLLFDLAPVLASLKQARAVDLSSDAEHLASAGDLDGAYQLIRKALELDPTQVGAQKLRRDLQKEREAAAGSRKAKELAAAAQQKLRARAFDDAIESLNAALNAAPTSALDLRAELARQLDEARRVRAWAIRGAELLERAGEKRRAGELTAAHQLASEAALADPALEAAAQLRDQLASELARLREQILAETGRRMREHLAEARYLEARDLILGALKRYTDDADLLRWLAEVDTAQRRAEEERARLAEAARLEAENQRRAEEAELQAQAERRRQEEARRAEAERARLAEAARLEDEARQQAEAERRRQENARRAEEERVRLAQAEAKRQAEARLAEEARVLREAAALREAEAKRQAEAEQRRQEELRLAEEERARLAALALREAEARQQAEAEQRRQQEARLAEEERVRQAALAQREAEAKQQAEAEQRRKEELRLAEEERARLAAALREAEVKRQAEAEVKRQAEAEQRRQQEARLAEEERVRHAALAQHEAEAKQQAEAEQRRKEELRLAEEERARLAAVAQRETEAKRQAETEQRRQEELRLAEEERARLAAAALREAEVKRQGEAKLRRQEEARLAEQERARLASVALHEAEAKRQAEAELRRQEEARRAEQGRARLAAVALREAEAKQQAEAEQRRKQEARQEEEERQRAGAAIPGAPPTPVALLPRPESKVPIRFVGIGVLAAATIAGAIWLGTRNHGQPVTPVAKTQKAETSSVAQSNPSSTLPAQSPAVYGKAAPAEPAGKKPDAAAPAGQSKPAGNLSDRKSTPGENVGPVTSPARQSSQDTAKPGGSLALAPVDKSVTATKQPTVRSQPPADAGTAAPPVESKATAPSQEAQDSAAVVAAVKAYAQAIHNKDINAVRTAWPSLPSSQADTLQSDFKNARSYTLDLRIRSTDVTGDTARVECEAVSRKDLGEVYTNTFTMRFTLRKQGGAWVISSVR